MTATAEPVDLSRHCMYGVGIRRTAWAPADGGGGQEENIFF